MRLDPQHVLPSDVDRATLIGRAWVPGPTGAPGLGGPSPILIDRSTVWDLSRVFPTVSELLNQVEPARLARHAVTSGWSTTLGDISALIDNSHADRRDPALPYLLSPCDLQAIRACGVTFVSSMVERVIEAITAAARTGKVGDGKIFVTDLHQSLRIRTGETGDNAL